MIELEVALATNRSGWNKVAPLFHGGTALPEYGPLAPTEDTLTLLDEVPGSRVLELGCGSGHSLRYLAERAHRNFGVSICRLCRLPSQKRLSGRSRPVSADRVSHGSESRSPAESL